MNILLEKKAIEMEIKFKKMTRLGLFSDDIQIIRKPTAFNNQ